MKKILAIFLGVLLWAQMAYADACSTGLMPLFTSAQAKELCATFPISSVATSALLPNASNTLDLGATSFPWRTIYLGTSRISLTSDILRVRQDAQRLFTWDASSDTAFTATFGDAGTTAVQGLTMSASTSDSDDDSTFSLAGGGAVGPTRGASVVLEGNEVSGGGDARVASGSASGSVVEIVSADDAQRPIIFTSSADTAMEIEWGDAGTTAVQDLAIAASTADADDDSTLYACGGGAYASDGSRGACIILPGEEVSGGSDISYVAGGSDTHIFKTGSTTTASIGATGLITAAAGVTATTGAITATAGDVVITAGDLSIVATGKTIEYETGTAGSACMGTSTFNGTTAVTVSTTCAAATSKIFFSPTSDGSGTSTNDQSGCWATNIVADTSFDLDCSDAAMSSTLNWIIYHESP